jgi:CDP-diacylglycerol---glycerol-3-phosphate 3-phosphatidyltransferase
MNLANKITTIRLILVPIFILILTPMPEWITNKNIVFHFINNNSIGIATTIFIVAALTDKLDGYFARKYNQITKLGCFLDPLADKLLIISALIFLVEENRVAGWIALIIIAREIAVTGLRVVAVLNKKVLAADKYGKIKLVFQVITIPLLLLKNYPLSLFTNFPFDNVMIFLTVIITIYSGINYFVKNQDVFCEDGKLIV